MISPKDGAAGKHFKLLSGEIVKCVSHTDYWLSVATQTNGLRVTSWIEVIDFATAEEVRVFEQDKLPPE